MGSIYITREEADRLLHQEKELLLRIGMYKPERRESFIDVRRHPEDVFCNTDLTAQEEKCWNQLQAVKSKLESAVVVEKEETEYICIGDKVVMTMFFAENDFEDMEVTLIDSTVSQIDGDLTELSVESPCGKAILGKKIGDVVDFKVDGNPISVKILGINDKLAHIDKGVCLSLEIK